MTNTRFRSRPIAPLTVDTCGGVGVWEYRGDGMAESEIHASNGRFFFGNTLLLCALLLAMVSTMGCEESVDPVLGTERAYTVYGFFNARADTQAMRIFAIEGSLALTRPEPLGARVISIDRQTGTEQVWQDSVTRFVSGRFGHVYWSAFRADFEHTYRLEATRPDGAVTRAEVTVPPLSEPLLLPPTVADRFVFLPVLWPHAPRLNDIRVRYRILCDTVGRDFEFDYPLDQEQVSGGSVVTVQFSNDVRQIFQDVLGKCPVEDLHAEAVEVLVLVSNAEWVPPTGVYDAELLVEPGTFTNVDNGFGFVGAGYPATFRYEIPDSIAIAAGFFVDDDG